MQSPCFAWISTSPRVHFQTPEASPCCLLVSLHPQLTLPCACHHLSSPCHGICTAWGLSASACGWAAAQLQGGDVGAADVPGPSQDIPKPSRQALAQQAASCWVWACVQRIQVGFFLLKHPTLPLLTVCSLLISWEAQWSVKQWLWHSSQPTPTLHSCS